MLSRQQSSSGPLNQVVKVKALAVDIFKKIKQLIDPYLGNVR